MASIINTIAFASLCIVGGIAGVLVGLFVLGCLVLWPAAGFEDYRLGKISPFVLYIIFTTDALGWTALCYWLYEITGGK